MATYYYAQDGTAANKGAATSGTYPGGCMSQDTATAETYAAGDFVRASDQGGEIQRASGVFSVSTSGSVGNPITYGAKASETPIFVGRTILTSGTYKWTASGSGTNEWYCELSGGGDPSLTDCHLFLVDDVPMTESEGSASDPPLLGSLADHEWGYGDNDTLGYETLYFRDDTGDPDGSGIVITVPQKGCFNCYMKEYVVIDGITVKYGYNPLGSMWVGDCNNITVQNCEAHWSGESGIMIKSSSDCTVDNCTASYNGAHNIGAGSPSSAKATGVTFKNCTAHHARVIGFSGSNPFDGYGFKFLWTDESYMYNNTAYLNEFQGIDLDGSGGIGCDDCEIYDNSVYDNESTGILIELNSNRNKVYRNLVYDNYSYNISLNSGCNDCELCNNVIYSTNSDVTFAIGIYNSRGTKIYGNVVDMGGNSNRLLTVDGTDSAVDTEIKNNIFIGSTSMCLILESSSYSGFECDYNVWERSDASTSIAYVDGTWRTIITGGTGTFFTVLGFGEHDINGDPGFTDEGSNDYTLASGSVCIGAGANLGSPYNVALMPGASWPDSVTTGDQDDY